jgi:2-haloacid dehalogenase
VTAARPRRPVALLVDVFETTLRLAGLRERFVELGRPGSELELFFTRTLRDGMAYTLAGAAPPFAEVAADALRVITGNALDEAAITHLLAGFRTLPAHPDIEPGLRAAAAAGVPVYAFSHGGADTVRAALTHAGLLERYAGVLSTEELHAFKPPPRVYHWACQRIGTPAARTALVAAHSWDTHGAAAAGLLTGLVTRLDGAPPAAVTRPDVQAPGFAEVVAGLLALPG